MRGWKSKFVIVCFIKQKTAYEMLISDWSSDVCSSDLETGDRGWTSPRPATSPPARHRANPGTPAPDVDAALGDRASAVAHRCPESGTTGPPSGTDSKSVWEGKSVSAREDLCGRRFIKKNTTPKTKQHNTHKTTI